VSEEVRLREREEGFDLEGRLAQIGRNFLVFSGGRFLQQHEHCYLFCGGWGFRFCPSGYPVQQHLRDNFQKHGAAQEGGS